MLRMYWAFEKYNQQINFQIFYYYFVTTYYVLTQQIFYNDF